MSRGYSDSHRSTDDLRPPPSGIRVCGEPPKPGDTLRTPDGRRWLVMANGSMRAYPEPPRPDPKPSRLDRLVDRLFCTACLRLRCSPLHLLVCPEHRAKVIRRHGR